RKGGINTITSPCVVTTHGRKSPSEPRPRGRLLPFCPPDQPHLLPPLEHLEPSELLIHLLDNRDWQLQHWLRWFCWRGGVFWRAPYSGRGSDRRLNITRRVWFARR